MKYAAKPRALQGNHKETKSLATSQVAGVVAPPSGYDWHRRKKILFRVFRFGSAGKSWQTEGLEAERAAQFEFGQRTLHTAPLQT